MRDRCVMLDFFFFLKKNLQWDWIVRDNNCHHWLGVRALSDSLEQVIRSINQSNRLTRNRTANWNHRNAIMYVM
jgi:hypothetical protein